MTKTRRVHLDKFEYSPIGRTPAHKAEFTRLMNEAKKQWPDLDLGYIGHDGINHHMQQWGNPTPYLIPLAPEFRKH